MKKTPATILIMDDDDDVLISSRLLLKQHFTHIITKSDGKEMNRLISTENIDVAILDMNYRKGFNDGKEGMLWLKHIKEINPDIVIILMTAFGEVELAVKAIKEGAFDFILKPWTNEKFLATVNAALELRKANLKVRVSETKNKVLNEQIDNQFSTVIGTSEPIQKIMRTIEKVSDTAANILILGENGTGKEHFARQIHKRSSRKNKPFIHVDLGSLSESLFESELFGHRKGAFTDAKEDKLGRFELAKGGTLFLDEIGNLPLNLQAKILTVLQSRKVTRLGEGIERPVDARLIFATNAPLRDWVDEGKFREDLLFRINTIEIEIPPLRKRKEDIPEFVQFFLSDNKRKYQKPNLTISDEAIEVLKNHRFPGNIRELQHTIERGVILSDGEQITPDDFNLNSHSSKKRDNELPDNLNLKDIEKLMVEKAIQKHSGNISKAAAELGLTRAALYRRMEKFDL